MVAPAIHAHDPRIGSTLRELKGAHPTAYAHVKNTSAQPVYEAEFRWHRGSERHGDPNPEPLGIIMPSGVPTTSAIKKPVKNRVAESASCLKKSPATINCHSLRRVSLNGTMRVYRSARIRLSALPTAL